MDLLVAILAVLKSGAAYVPVDTGYPADRIGYLLTDAEPALVLATADTAADSARRRAGRSTCSPPPTSTRRT